MTLLNTALNFKYNKLSCGPGIKGCVLMGKVYSGSKAVLFEKPEIVQSLIIRDFILGLLFGWFCFSLILFFPRIFTSNICFKPRSMCTCMCPFLLGPKNYRFDGGGF